MCYLQWLDYVFRQFGNGALKEQPSLALKRHGTSKLIFAFGS